MIDGWLSTELEEIRQRQERREEVAKARRVLGEHPTLFSRWAPRLLGIGWTFFVFGGLLTGAHALGNWLAAIGIWIGLPPLLWALGRLVKRIDQAM